MGSFNLAKICELVGIYILNIFKRNIFLVMLTFTHTVTMVLQWQTSFRDQVLRGKLITIKVFLNIGFDITTEANLLVADFVDVT